MITKKYILAALLLATPLVFSSCSNDETSTTNNYATTTNEQEFIKVMNSVGKKFYTNFSESQFNEINDGLAGFNTMLKNDTSLITKVATHKMIQLATSKFSLTDYHYANSIIKQYPNAKVAMMSQIFGAKHKYSFDNRKGKGNKLTVSDIENGFQVEYTDSDNISYNLNFTPVFNTKDVEDDNIIISRILTGILQKKLKTDTIVVLSQIPSALKVVLTKAGTTLASADLKIANTHSPSAIDVTTASITGSGTWLNGITMDIQEMTVNMADKSFNTKLNIKQNSSNKFDLTMSGFFPNQLTTFDFNSLLSFLNGTKIAKYSANVDDELKIEGSASSLGTLFSNSINLFKFKADSTAISTSINMLDNTTTTYLYYGTNFDKKATAKFAPYRDLGTLTYYLGRNYMLENGEVITRPMFINNGGIDYLNATFATYTASITDLTTLFAVIVNAIKDAQ
jgi:hypothetical protein